MAYNWPGNVRELENVIERAMILHRNEQLRFDELGSSLMGKADGTAFTSDAGTLILDALVKKHIQRVLKKPGARYTEPGALVNFLG